MDENLTELFHSASSYVRSVAGRLKADDLLYLYARFKQVSEGRCNTERPGFFDFQGKQKWDAWNAMKSKSSAECMMEYITKVTDLDPCWEDKAKSSSHSKSGLGVCVSRMASEEEEIEESQKTIFDWCRDGNIDVVEKMLGDISVTDINALDENGMSLLHWSCDRGHKEIVRLLLERSADVNILDSESQTPLHYAISCDYPDIAQVLLCHGADVNMKDSEGNSPLDLAEPKTLLVT